MKLPGLVPGLLACLAVIVIGFVAFSLFDIVIAVLNTRFYSPAAFITIFGVGGIFAGLMAYTYGISAIKTKNELARWSLIGTIIVLGAIFYFLLARIEGGEYEIAFKSYGITSALSSLLMAKGKVD
ncbi:MAG: hypothetical protein NTW29_07160 [Bacteroidetes bacterium]|nr:hypothetical protein [Bacteroidota bacterium]